MRLRDRRARCGRGVAGLVVAVLCASPAPLSAVNEDPDAATPADTSDQTRPVRPTHIRSLDPIAEWLVRAGAMYSGTFRRMLEAIEQSDVVAYVTVASTLPSSISGKISFIGATAGVRYVKIIVRPGDDALPSIVMLGHELRHAMEIVSAHGIQDSESMADAYRSSGVVRVHRGKAVADTWEAVATASEIDHELRSRGSLLALELEVRQRALRRSARNPEGAHSVGTCTPLPSEELASKAPSTSAFACAPARK